MRRLVAVLLLIVSTATAQNPNTDIDPDVIREVFGGPPEPSSTTVAGAPIHYGGDGKGNGDCICVPYHNCDENRVLKLDGEVDGFGVIDIRFGKNKCDHFLDLCCTYPTDTGGNTGPTDGGLGSTERPVTPPVIPETPPPTLPPKEAVRCGIRNANGLEFNIAGNSDREAEYAEFPWMVAILKNNWTPAQNDTLAICGGSLIHPQVVLTGAHCVQKFQPSDIKIRVGEWDTQTTKERYPYQERNVRQIITHKDYKKEVLWNDIALLVLTEPVDYAANVKPLCLPEQDHVYDEKECFVSGWGKTVFASAGSRSVILKKIDLPIVQNKRCQDALRKTRLGDHFSLHHSFICAGGIANKDACTGDGGGPLVCPDKLHPGRYTQAGIVAWGIGCGEENVPGVYANVAGFKHWVDTQMNTLNFDTSSYTY